MRHIRLHGCNIVNVMSNRFSLGPINTDGIDESEVQFSFHFFSCAVLVR